MSKEKSKLFTIGQFAAIYGINKKTLMWYDEVGLFKPAAINEENGYRCYSYYQSTELETILLLRDMKVSIKDIQEFMQHRSAQSMEQLLKDKITELDETIDNLKAIRSRLSHQHRDMEALLDLDWTKISIIEKEPQYLATALTTPEQTLEEDIEAVVHTIKKYNLPRVFQDAYGSMIAVDSLYRGDFYEYTHLFIQMPKTIHRKGLHKQPGGKYLQAFCKGSWDMLPSRYAQILEYATAHHIRLTGFSYETVINEMVIDTMEGYITKIEIPIAW